MTLLQREALQMCLEYIETDAHERRHVRWKINEALAEQPAQRKPLPYNKEDMKDLDVNQRLAFKLGWKSAEEAHGIKENT